MMNTLNYTRHVFFGFFYYYFIFNGNGITIKLLITPCTDTLIRLPRHLNGRKFEFLLPDFRFSDTTNDFVRLTRNDRRRIERKNVSGIRLNLGVSGALRSGRKKFFTANIVILSWDSFQLNLTKKIYFK